MRYWFVHIILVGLLVALWVPTMVAPTYKSVEAMEDYALESSPMDSTFDEYLPPPPMATPPEEAVSGASPEEVSIVSEIVDNLKELGSLIIMFGNVLTFFWQWKDRKAKKVNAA